MQPVVEPTEEVEDRETNPPWTRIDGDNRPTGYESAPESGPRERQTLDPTESQDDKLSSGQTGATDVEANLVSVRTLGPVMSPAAGLVRHSA